MQISNKLVVKEKTGYHFISFSEIYYIEGNGMYSTVYLKDTTHIITKSLKSIEGRMPSETFLRIHQSYLVNLNKIKHVFTNSRNIVVLDTNLEIPVSKSKLCLLKTVLNSNYIIL